MRNTLHTLARHGLSLLVALLALSAGYAQQTKTLHTIDDTYIYKDEIHGMEPLLLTYHSTAGSQYRRETFIKFDLASLAPNIENVILRLYANDMATGTDKGKHTFAITPVAKTDWAEDDMSYNDYLDKVGTLDNTILAQIEDVLDGTAAGWYEWSSPALTQAVQKALDNGQRYMALRLKETTVVKKPNGDGIICEFRSKEHTEGAFAPQLVVQEQDVSPMLASWIKLAGQPLATFDAATYRYAVRLPYNATTLPEVTAAAVNASATVVVVPPASVNLAGPESQRTTQVRITAGGKTLTYSMVFELLPPPTDTRLLSIAIDGVPLEFFESNKSQYTHYLPYTQVGVPTLTATTNDPQAHYSVQPATAITGAVAARTTTITVVSADGSTTGKYQVVFEQLPEMDIILAIGQSNMSGRAEYDDVAGPMDNVYLLTPGGNMEVSANPMNKYSNIRKDLNIQGLSPAYMCAVGLQAELNKPVAFVVNAQGGSSISVWYQAGKANYDASLKRAREAQRFGRIKAIIWHQGSADNSAGLQDNFASYKTNLKKMVDNFRADLNEPDIFFVCGELADRPELKEFSRQVIFPVASYITKADYVVVDSTRLRSDGLHFDAPSVKIMGARYAAKVLERVYSNTSMQATAGWIKAGGQAVPGFKATAYHYYVSLAYGTTAVPQVSAAPVTMGATVSITQATAVAGTEAERTATVRVSLGGVTTTYTLVFDVGAPEVTAAWIKANDVVLPGFSPSQYQYAITLPATATTVPTITAGATNTQATVSIQQATNLTGTQAERTATVQVSASGFSRQYTVVFTKEGATAVRTEGSKPLAQAYVSGRMLYVQQVQQPLVCSVVSLATGAIMWRTTIQADTEVPLYQLAAGAYAAHLRGGAQRQSVKFVLP